MSILSALYATVVRTRNHLYDRRTLPVRALSGAVVSVGNLSVGGSGKTPFVILLGELLKQREISFDVLSRGYGRRNRGVRLVDPSGSAEDFGDEPLLISRRLGCPVIVGEDRYKAGIFAEKKFGPQLHILDDGFQHRSLARDFDVVLLAPEDIRDLLLPSGRLRESLDALRRADVMVLSEDTDPSPVARFGKPIWGVRRGIKLASAPPKPIVFCGIARPHRFLQDVSATRIEPVAQKVFRDHHAYSEADIEALRLLKEQHGAGGFITTEKDAVNLGSRIEKLGPVAIAQVTMEITDPADALDTMLRVIRDRKRKA